MKSTLRTSSPSSSLNVVHTGNSLCLALVVDSDSLPALAPVAFIVVIVAVIVVIVAVIVVVIVVAIVVVIVVVIAVLIVCVCLRLGCASVVN